MIIDKRCFKIDKNNAKAMIYGYKCKGVHLFQAIYCDVVLKPFPMLITLNRSKTPFKLSDVGVSQTSESFDMPYKYVAFLESEYFIKNDLEMWNEICENGLFNIWPPESPYKRFNISKSDSQKFRILLLRIYEIYEEFQKNDIMHKSSRVDHIYEKGLNIEIKKPIIDDNIFSDTRHLLEKSIAPYLIKKKLHSDPH